MNNEPTNPVEIDEAELGTVVGGGSQNNLKQLGLAALDPAPAPPSGINVLMADGSVRGVSPGVKR